MDHPKGLREITRVSLSVQALDQLSPTAQMIEQAGILSIASSPEPVLELGFDDETAGQHKDFRPHLPVVFCW